MRAEDNVPKAARRPDLLATRFIKLIGKLFAAEARSQTWKAHGRQRRRYSARVRVLRLAFDCGSFILDERETSGAVSTPNISRYRIPFRSRRNCSRTDRGGAGALAVDAHVGNGIEPESGCGVDGAEFGQFEPVQEVLLDVAHAVLDTPLLVAFAGVAGNDVELPVARGIEVARIEYRRLSTPAYSDSRGTASGSREIFLTHHL